MLSSAFFRGERDVGDWLVILPTGRLVLSPGEEVEIVATFEPMYTPGKREGGLAYDFKFEVDGEVYTVPVRVRYYCLEEESVPTERVRVEVFDAESKQPVPEAEVMLSLPSGLLAEDRVTGPEGVAEFWVPSSSYVQSMYEKYNATVSFSGYFLEVYKAGYKAFYGYGVETRGSVKVYLEPQRVYFEYEKVGEIQTEFAVWWIKAPKDCSYFVTSPGSHAHVKPPSETAIYVLSPDGKVVSRYPIKVEGYEATDICWGLDVSPDGSYFAAGCYDGHVYLFDRTGKLVGVYEAGATVRLVKFSPDGRYLAFGPTKRGADYFGVFSVPDLTLVWEGFVGDWSRTVAFSEDGGLVAVGSSNGVLTLFSADGKKLWQSSNGGLVPFVIGFDAKGDRLVTGGKGRTLIVYDRSGRVVWKRFLDHVIIAGGISADGAVAVGTVGGIVYYFNPDGSLSFRRIQGGVEHNGVYLTRNGKYVLLGGMNPTLLDSNGTVLWQLKPGEKARLTAPNEELNAVNAVFLSEDASVMVLGYNNGKVEFWKRKAVVVKEEKPAAAEKQEAPKESETNATQVQVEPSPPQVEPSPEKPEEPPPIIPVAILALVVVAILVLRRRRPVQSSKSRVDHYK